MSHRSYGHVAMSHRVLTRRVTRTHLKIPFFHYHTIIWKPPLLSMASGICLTLPDGLTWSRFSLVLILSKCMSRCRTSFNFIADLILLVSSRLMGLIYIFPLYSKIEISRSNFYRSNYIIRLISTPQSNETALTLS